MGMKRRISFSALGWVPKDESKTKTANMISTETWKDPNPKKTLSRAVFDTREECICNHRGDARKRRLTLIIEDVD